jgi:hypothetical protein
VAAAAVAALGWFPTRRLAGAGGTTALGAGCTVAWLGSMVGGVPVMLGELRLLPPVTAALAASALRPAAVIAVAAAVAVSGRLSLAPFLVWTALAHLVMLAVDTLYAAAAGGRRVPILGAAGTRRHDT